MFDEEEYGSDSSDEDYVPDAGGGDGPSDDDSGEDEDIDDLVKDAEDSTSKIKGKRKGAKKKNEDVNVGRKRKGGIRLEDEAESALAEAEEKEDEEQKKKLEEAIKEEQEQKKAEEEKRKADDLWASFMSDVPSIPKRKPAAASGLGALSGVIKTSSKTLASKTAQEKGTALQRGENSCTAKGTSAAKPNKITITKEYDFAGETVRVTKEVDADSKEAKAEQKRKEQAEEAAASKPTLGASIPGLKRPSGGGLGSVLGKIGKKPKMGTLEKSRLDWNDFKDKEGIGEELSIHNRGKEGYIERQAFLNRADQRQFEQERNLRLSSKR